MYVAVVTLFMVPFWNGFLNGRTYQLNSFWTSPLLMDLKNILHKFYTPNYKYKYYLLKLLR